MLRILLVFTMALFLSAAQAPSGPNLAAQREAMKKLDFMPGKWTGEASIYRGPGEPIKILQTEEVQYKLDGLILLVEGTGRDTNGKIVFRALATIAYDDAAKQYRFRSYNDGRYLDTDLKVNDNGWEWGYAVGQGRARFTMRLNGRDEWTETGEFLMGDNPPRKTIEMKVRREK